MTRTKFLLALILIIGLLSLALVACDELITEVTEITQVALSADFSVSAEVCCAPCSVLFDDLSAGGVVTRIWNFGDGSTPDTTHESIVDGLVGTEFDSISHIYTDGGYFDVTLTVIDTLGHTDSEIKKRFIIVDRASATFTVDSLDGCRPFTVQFYSSNFKANSHWHWDFGDAGDADTSPAPNPTYTYADGGTYTVMLIATNNFCDTSFADTMIWVDSVVVQDCPIADFAVVGPDSGCVPLPVVFSSLTTGTFDTLIWSFGDGGVDTVTSLFGDPITHYYFSTGTHTVSLQASGPSGSSTATQQDVITVDPTIVAVFTADTLYGCNTMSVTFTETSTGQIDSILWTFGDGFTSTTPGSVVHDYAGIGQYQVSLVAFGGCGPDTMIGTDPITIFDTAPVANFQVVIDTNVINDSLYNVAITDLSTTGFLWRWLVDSSLIANTPTPPNQLLVAGQHEIELIVTNGCGADTLLQTISVPSKK